MVDLGKDLESRLFDCELVERPLDMAVVSALGKMGEDGSKGPFKLCIISAQLATIEACTDPT